jgi:tetratricopeptide (TPR) repeat protein
LSLSVDLELMRAASCLGTDPAAAARHASAILDQAPSHPEAVLLLAEACRRMGDPARAVELLTALSKDSPRAAFLHYELGRALAGCDRAQEALSALERAIELEPSLSEAWRELAVQRFKLGDELGGDVAYLRYGRLARSSPELADAWSAFAVNRADAAEAMVHARLAQSPDNVEALRLLASIARAREDRDAAERHMRRALSIAPGDAEAREQLARLLYEQERVQESLPLIERLLTADPGSIDYALLKAQTLRLMGRTHEALSILQALSDAHPDHAEMWLVYGLLRREVGDQPGCIIAYRRALELKPGYGEAYWALANLKTVRLDEQDIQSMQREIDSTGRFLDSNGTHLEFALGKALEDAGRHAQAFEHYQRGNARKRATFDYDPSLATQFARRCATTFSAEFFAQRRDWGSQREDPIFIVGMPRSGSTLIEQILASHSEVEGTRELTFLPAIARQIAVEAAAQGSQEYPECVASLSRDEVAALAAAYLQQTESLRSQGRPRFVDKMLGNFSHIGLIQLMFPRAAIIDSRRLAMACGFSCFKQLFARGMRQSYDLRELGLYHRDYLNHMEAVGAALPGRVYRVHYDTLVNDTDGEIRRLLEYCRLPFEPQCLRFYENSRSVQTVSSEQVRRPIFREGLEQWRHYEAWLGPLRCALEEKL